MPRGNQARVPQLLGPLAATTEARGPRICVPPQRETDEAQQRRALTGGNSVHTQQ